MSFSKNISVRRYAENAYLIVWNNENTDKNLSYALRVQQAFGTAGSVEKERAVEECVIASSSAMIIFKKAVNEKLAPRFIYEKLNEVEEKAIKTHEHHIPVCYDAEFGIDLKDLAEYNGLEIEDVIKLHVEQRYSVMMTGFLPGFAYLGDVNERIQFPRKANPRPRITRGSVGIANNRTGIYPVASPGGWNIIGRSPVKLFDWESAKPRFNIGDEVTFYKITKEVFDQWQ